MNHAASYLPVLGAPKSRLHVTDRGQPGRVRRHLSDQMWVCSVLVATSVSWFEPTCSDCRCYNQPTSTPPPLLAPLRSTAAPAPAIRCMSAQNLPVPPPTNDPCWRGIRVH